MSKATGTGVKANTKNTKATGTGTKATSTTKKNGSTVAPPTSAKTKAQIDKEKKEALKKAQEAKAKKEAEEKARIEAEQVNTFNLDEILNDEGLYIVPEESMRETQIEKTQTTKSVRWIGQNRDKIRDDLAIQRNKDMWSHQTKSLLIHTLIEGYTVPPIHTIDSNDGQFWLLDGKQRVTSILQYINNEWELHDETPNALGKPIHGVKFENLQSHLKAHLLNAELFVWVMKNVSEAEIEEQFLRLNAGTPMSKIDITKVLAGGKVRDYLVKLWETPFFKNRAHMTKDQIKKNTHHEMLLQLLILITGKDVSFGYKDVRDFATDLRESDEFISDEITKVMVDTSEYLDKAFEGWSDKERRQGLRKVHTPMVFMTGIQARLLGIHHDLFGQWARDFLITNYKVGSNYGKASNNGSANKDKVKTRMAEMLKHFESHFKVKEKIGRDGVSSEVAVTIDPSLLPDKIDSEVQSELTLQ